MVRFGLTAGGSERGAQMIEAAMLLVFVTILALSGMTKLGAKAKCPLHYTGEKVKGTAVAAYPTFKTSSPLCQ